MREWPGRVGVKTLFIEPGLPWENGYIESFNGKLRDELLEREAFDTLLEAKVPIDRIIAQKQRKTSAADFTIVSGNPFLSAVVTLHVHCPLPTPPKSRRDCCQL